jgi:hypothetical protein
MTKTTYPIPSGCTGVTIEQEGEVVIVKFETERVERWRGGYLDTYMFIEDGIIYVGWETGSELDNSRYNSDNYFEFAEDAQDKLNKINEINQ